MEGAKTKKSWFKQVITLAVGVAGGLLIVKGVDAVATKFLKKG